MIAWFSRKKKIQAPTLRKDDFVAISSHELRSPLSIIKWYTEILLDEDAGPLNEEQKKYLNVIESSNQRAIDLIRSLLNVSRLDLDTFSIFPEDVDLSDHVSSAITAAKPLATEKNVEILEEKQENLPKIMLDKHLCALVLRQPLTNAIAFSSPGSKILVSLFFAKKGSTVGGTQMPKDSVVVYVKDTGLGIPPNDQPQIFGRMFRGSNAEDSPGSDSGLGLHIAKTVMNLSQVDGDIWFESELGKGTTFYIAFPTKGMKKKEGRTVLE
jgi:signal transduction histidine kinase